jgi:hypothetical protein
MANRFFSTTLRPGYLVGLKTSISGNVKYLKTTIQPDALDVELGIHTSKWETERKILNAAEQEAATKLRSEIRTMIGRYCSQTAFGMLCPNDAKEALDQAMAAAQEKAAEFNRSATTTRIRVNAMCGKIEPDDQQAVRAINSEVAELLETMRLGLETLDAVKVRDAAKRAREIGQMLSADAQARITIAIEAARATATRIAKAGETNAVEIDRLAISRVTEARTAFLDLDQEGEVQAPATTGRALDLAPDGEVVTAPKAPTREMEVNN